MLDRKYQEILRNLENNIKDKETLKYVKEQFSNLSIIFADEVTKVEAKYETRLNNLENKIDFIENTIKKLENDLYEGEEADLEPINCPYCNFNFLIDATEKSSEVNCPECGNIIELDWEDDDSSAEDDDM